MNGLFLNESAPIIGSGASLILITWGLYRESIQVRRLVLLSVILVTAVSIAFYWNAAPEALVGGVSPRFKRTSSNYPTLTDWPRQLSELGG